MSFLVSATIDKQKTPAYMAQAQAEYKNYMDTKKSEFDKSINECIKFRQQTTMPSDKDFQSLCTVEVLNNLETISFLKGFGLVLGGCIILTLLSGTFLIFRRK